MPTIVASEILGKAAILLQDADNTRWPLTELLAWLNDGVREIASARPDQSSKYVNIALVPGTRQALPDDAIELLRVVRNTGASGAVPGKAIRIVAMDLLDLQLPDWHSGAPHATVKSYCYDPRNPRAFYVFPPADGTSKVEVLYTAPPARIATVADVIPIDDMFTNVLLDYVMFRAYSKDAENGSMDLAEAHRKAFSDSLAAKSEGDQTAAPKAGVRE